MPFFINGPSLSFFTAVLAITISFRGEAQIFKVSKPAEVTSESNDKAPNAKKPAGDAKPAGSSRKQSGNVPSSKTKPAARSEKPPHVAETKSTTPPPIESMGREGKDDCIDVAQCLEAIRSTLQNMHTPDELKRLEQLTLRAESLAAESENKAAAAEGEVVMPTPAATDAVSPQAEAQSPEAAATQLPPPAGAEPTSMDPARQTELMERVARLEAELAAVSAKTEANTKQIDARESKSGFKIYGPGGSVFSIGALLQTRMETAENAAPNAENWSFGLYIRRMRLMFFGQLTDWLNFFIETEQVNFGLNGDWTGRVFIQDAYVEFNPHPAFQVDVGMMLPSFSRHSMQSATSLLGMDYHAVLIKFPVGSNLVWRDMGAKIRGLVLKDHLDYRIEIWSGVHGSGTDPRNPKDLPRVSGRLTANVFEAEGGGGVGGMFYDGLYLKLDGNHVFSTKKILSFGASFDWQPDLNVAYAQRDPNAAPEDPDVPVSYSDYLAFAGDVFWDIPFGETRIFSVNGQMDFYYYDHGDRRAGQGNWYYNVAGNTANYTGFGLFGEYGFRYSQFQPLFSFDMYNSTESDGNTGDYLNFSGGFNYYLLAHAATFKILVGADKANDGDWNSAVKFQIQLVF